MTFNSFIIMNLNINLHVLHLTFLLLQRNTLIDECYGRPSDSSICHFNSSLNNTKNQNESTCILKCCLTNKRTSSKLQIVGTNLIYSVVMKNKTCRHLKLMPFEIEVNQILPSKTSFLHYRDFNEIPYKVKFFNSLILLLIVVCQINVFFYGCGLA